MMDFIKLPGHEGQTYYVRYYEIGIVKEEPDIRGCTILLTTYEDQPVTLTTLLSAAEVFALIAQKAAPQPATDSSD